MPEVIHCSICGKAIKVKNFPDQMAKLRRHRKEKHPTAFKRSMQQAVKTRKKRR